MVAPLHRTEALLPGAGDCGVSRDEHVPLNNAAPMGACFCPAIDMGTGKQVPLCAARLRFVVRVQICMGLRCADVGARG